MNHNKLFVENIRLAIAHYADARSALSVDESTFSNFHHAISNVERVLSKSDVDQDYLAYGKANLETMAEDINRIKADQEKLTAEEVQNLNDVERSIDRTLEIIVLSMSLRSSAQPQHNASQVPDEYEDRMSMLSYLAKESIGALTSAGMAFPLAYQFLQPHAENAWEKFKSSVKSMDLGADAFQPTTARRIGQQIDESSDVQQALSGELLTANMTMKEHSEYKAEKNFLNALDSAIDDVRDEKSENFEKSGGRLEQAIDSLSDNSKEKMSEISKRFVQGFDELNKSKFSQAVTAFVNKIKELLSKVFSINTQQSQTLTTTHNSLM